MALSPVLVQGESHSHKNELLRIRIPFAFSTYKKKVYLLLFLLTRTKELNKCDRVAHEKIF
jgi:hypothetical protein